MTTRRDPFEQLKLMIFASVSDVEKRREIWNEIWNIMHERIVLSSDIPAGYNIDGEKVNDFDPK